MKRRVMLILAGISLLVCLTIATLWMTGATIRSKGIRQISGNWQGLASCSDGHVFVELYHVNPTPPVGPVIKNGKTSSETDAWSRQFGAEEELRRAGVRIGKMPLYGADQANHITMDGRTWWLEVPDWLLVVLASIAPLIALRGTIRRGREIPPGCCRRCGYDLRATPERCPECGAVQAELSLV